MIHRPDTQHRRSIRLQGYDYSRAGAYFITICAQNRKCLFGKFVNGKMGLNNAGMMVQAVWDEIPAHYPGIDIDAFIVMPNHIHGIVVIVRTATRDHPDDGNGQNNGQAQGPAPTTAPDVRHDDGKKRTAGLSLPDVVHRFKTMTTKQYAHGVKQNHWPRFSGKLWQRNYYERIILDENELNRIRQYIMDNPARWDIDRENPDMANRQ